MFGDNNLSFEINILMANQMWHDEWVDWDFNTHECVPGRQCLHFTQQVWKDTRRVCYGAAKVGRRTYVVARYQPRGNFIIRDHNGQTTSWDDNVRPSNEVVTSKPTNPTTRSTNRPSTKTSRPVTTPRPVQGGSEQSCQSTISSVADRSAICTAISDANRKRVIHHAPPMEVDLTLCQHAQSYAQHLAQKNNGLNHDSNLLNRLQEGNFYISLNRCVG